MKTENIVFATLLDRVTRRVVCAKSSTITRKIFGKIEGSVTARNHTLEGLKMTRSMPKEAKIDVYGVYTCSVPPSKLY